MSPELKAKWLEALRSGKYKQGTGYLRTFADEFCCLGVLADINGEQWQRPGKKTGRTEYFLVDSSDKILPEKFGSLGPKYDKEIKPDYRAKLMMMNDWALGGGNSFDDIADWIEKNV
jgi:hypothetical protein